MKRRQYVAALEPLQTGVGLVRSRPEAAPGRIGRGALLVTVRAYSDGGT